MRKPYVRGWIKDVCDCVDQIPEDEFVLEDVYAFEDYLSGLHPDNNHVLEKIRQQLQTLRDDGLIEFLGNGRYRKL